LAEALKGTLSPDEAIRNPAEGYVIAVKKTQGYSPALLSITGDSTLSREVKLAASIGLG
jgi:hypothetical protein